MDDTQQPTNPADGADSVAGASEAPIASLRSVRAQVEMEAIRSALARTGWNRKQAARSLGISYRALLYKIRDAGLPSNRANKRRDADSSKVDIAAD